jgi:hypothetical protein
MENSSLEKRKCKRYNLTDFVVAVSTTRLGRVINISASGIAIKLIDADFKSLPEECKISLLTRAKGFLVEELPLKIVRKELIPASSRNSEKIQTIGAKFNIADAIKRCKVKQFLFELS